MQTCTSTRISCPRKSSRNHSALKGLIFFRSSDKPPPIKNTHSGWEWYCGVVVETFGLGVEKWAVKIHVCLSVCMYVCWDINTGSILQRRNWLYYFQRHYWVVTFIDIINITYRNIFHQQWGGNSIKRCWRQNNWHKNYLCLYLPFFESHIFIWFWKKQKNMFPYNRIIKYTT